MLMRSGIIRISGPVREKFGSMPFCTKAGAYLWPCENSVEKKEFFILLWQLPDRSKKGDQVLIWRRDSNYDNAYS